MLVNATTHILIVRIQLKCHVIVAPLIGHSNQNVLVQVLYITETETICNPK